MSQEQDPATALPGAVAPGGEIAGYRLEEQIGAGGMAVVYRAHDEHLGRDVALKLLAPGLAADSGFRQRFIRESRAAAAVDHPHIIPIYDAGDAGGVLFIAMRFVHGGDVGSLLETDGPLPAARAWTIISQVAEALDAAHAHGLIHRDVKPANMLLDARPATAGATGDSAPAAPPEHVYLSDFGISKQPLSGGGLTATGQFVGTLDYIAPEQIDGHRVDGRADLYSLGCAAYELLSGVPPFRRDHGLAMITAHLSEPPPSLTARRGDLPPAVDQVLASAMAKSPDDRYATCAQFATDLGRSLGLVRGEPEPPRAFRQPATVHAVRVPGPGAGPAGDVTPGGRKDPADRAWPARPGGPQGPYGPNGPASRPQMPAPRSRAVLTGVIAVAAAAAVVAGAAVAVALISRGRPSSSPTAPPRLTATAQSQSPSQSPSPSPSPSPSAEALAVSNLLMSGAGSSVALTDAADNVGSCTHLPRSVRQIQQVRDQRQAEYDQARNLSTDALRSGAELRTDLVQALADSLNADNDYLSWARQQAAHCQFGSQSSAALAQGRQAVTDKAAFVRLWNPIATQYRLPATSVSSM
jgi:serine/threonine-protein kinase